MAGQANMTQQIVTGDIAEAAAQLLQANERRLAEQQAQFQASFESREAKFNADLDAMSPKKKTKSSRNSESSGTWLLARKCWEWLHDR